MTLVIIIEHDLNRQKTLLRWQGLVLEARLQSDYVAGQRVCWMIQPATVLLHRRDRKSNGERENPLSGTIIEYYILGGYANIVIRVDKKLNINITMTVPLHVAQRNRLDYGEKITISLLAAGIHLMPYTELRDTKWNQI